MWTTGQYTRFGGGTEYGPSAATRTADDRLASPGWPQWEPGTRRIVQQFGPVTVIDYYVDTASSGGDGTTNATSGANAAFASLATAFSTLVGLGNVWLTQNRRPRINCVGTAADAGCSTGTWADLSNAHYLEVVGNATSSLVYDTSKYRIENATGSGGAIFNNGCPYLLTRHIQAKHTISAPTGGRVTFNVSGPVNGWTIHEQCHAWGSIVNTQASVVSAFQTSPNSGDTHALVVRNCCIHDYIGTGQTHVAIVGNVVGTSIAYAYNNTIYHCGNGLVSNATNILAKNNGVWNCTDGYAGTFITGSTNNASDLASDAPGANPRNSVTPTLVNLAGGDFHLAAADTAWKDQGADLSADALWPFTTDGDGDTR